MLVWQPKGLEQVKFGFSRSARLLKPAEFRHVFADAESVACRQLRLLFRPCELGRTRIGFALTKKAVKRAVDRNRIKRVFRDSFRLNQHEMGSVDIIVLARRGASDLDNAALQKLANDLWLRLEKSYKKSQSLASAPSQQDCDLS